MKINTTLLFSFIAVAFIVALGSCAKKQVKNDIEGTWTAQEFLVDGEIFFQPSTNNSMVWTFNDGTLTDVTTYTDGPSVVTETDPPIKYKIKDKGETLWLGADYEWTIVELTSSKLVMTSEAQGEVAQITFTK